jgi:multisubunit Na+/H+ antiporter MnhB subunit
VNVELLLDIFLMAGVLAVAYRAIHAPALFTGVVLYIAFGLLLALVWVRLEAPDLALAEAAIGAGITGALLLDAAGQLGSGSPLRSRASFLARSGAAVGAAAVAMVLIAVGLTVAERRPSLQPLVRARLPESGVDHAVTAVLLNYRAYDTWLEVGVLLTAGLGVLALRRTRTPVPRRSSPASGVAAAASALIAPFALLVAGYLLWRGSYAPGGAFQAGAIAGAAGVFLVLLGWAPSERALRRWLRPALVLGFGSFLLAGLSGIARGGAFLQFPTALAGLIIVLVEGAVAISTAVTLVLLFAAARGPDGVPGEPPR